jgi:hypothetical protein
MQITTVLSFFGEESTYYIIYSSFIPLPKNSYQAVNFMSVVTPQMENLRPQVDWNVSINQITN